MVRPAASEENKRIGLLFAKAVCLTPPIVRVSQRSRSAAACPILPGHALPCPWAVRPAAPGAPGGRREADGRHQSARSRAGGSEA